MCLHLNCCFFPPLRKPTPCFPSPCLCLLTHPSALLPFPPLPPIRPSIASSSCPVTVASWTCSPPSPPPVRPSGSSSRASLLGCSRASTPSPPAPGRVTSGHALQGEALACSRAWSKVLLLHRLQPQMRCRANVGFNACAPYPLVTSFKGCG